MKVFHPDLNHIVFQMLIQVYHWNQIMYMTCEHDTCVGSNYFRSMSFRFSINFILFHEF